MSLRPTPTGSLKRLEWFCVSRLGAGGAHVYSWSDGMGGVAEVMSTCPRCREGALPGCAHPIQHPCPPPLTGTTPRHTPPLQEDGPCWGGAYLVLVFCLKDTTGPQLALSFGAEAVPVALRCLHWSTPPPGGALPSSDHSLPPAWGRGRTRLWGPLNWDVPPRARRAQRPWEVEAGPATPGAGAAFCGCPGAYSPTRTHMHTAFAERELLTCSSYFYNDSRTLVRAKRP